MKAGPFSWNEYQTAGRPALRSPDKTNAIPTEIARHNRSFCQRPHDDTFDG
jgi:hypothetical protein